MHLKKWVKKLLYQRWLDKMENYGYKSITELHNLLKDKQVSSADLVKWSLKKSEEAQNKYQDFDYMMEDTLEAKVTDNLVSGIPYGVKANYSTKDILSTGSSNTLNNYVPFFNATVIEKLNAAGALPINKTAMDEFGMGGTGTTARTGTIKNPWDPTRMCAGSSSGSACAVAYGVYPFALGSDTGDSIRKPAAYCGIVGYKPTYGMISRYGLFPFASSLDHCGVLTRNVKDAAIVVNTMKGIDKNDMTSWDSSNIDLTDLDGKVTNKKLCYIKEICNLDEYPNANDELKEHLTNFKNNLQKIKELGIEIEEVSIDKTLLNAIASTYVVISCAEATSNMSNLTGIIFGPRSEGKTYIESMKDYRTKGLSSLSKRRFVIGSYVLQSQNKDRYFFNAQRVRRLLVDAWKKLFEKYDAVILPVGSGPAKKIENTDDILDNNTTVLEEHLQVGNFGGFPSITIPDGFINNLPVALNITGNCYDDKNVLNIAFAIENKLGYKNQVAKEVS